MGTRRRPPRSMLRPMRSTRPTVAMCCLADRSMRWRPATGQIRRRESMIRPTLWLLTLALMQAGVSSAFACRGKTVLSAEQYAPSAEADFEKKGRNEFELRPQPDKLLTRSALQVPDGNVGLCAEVTMLSTGDPSDSGVGVTFWRESDDNYYFVELSASGKVRLVHVVFGRWHMLLPYTEAAMIKPGLGEWNEVEVWPMNSGIDVIINGQ